MPRRHDLIYEVMTIKPRILVLLAAYNGATWICEQIRTILAQDDVDVAIAIADDRSNDATAARIAEAFGNHPAISVTTWDKGSGSAGANFRRLFRTVSVDSYDYVALADQDDIWHARKLSVAVEALRRTGADGYSCATTAFWEDGKEEILSQSAAVRDMDFLFEGAGQGCTFVMTAGLFREVQRFCSANHALSEKFHYHDWLIYLLARAWGKRWHFDQQPWLRYRQHANNEIGSKGSFGSIVKRLELIRNGWYRRQIAAAVEIYLRERTDVKIVYFEKVLSAPDSVLRRLRMSRLVITGGRRRLSDRSVLAISALAGWI